MTIEARAHGKTALLFLIKIYPHGLIHSKWKMESWLLFSLCYWASGTTCEENFFAWRRSPYYKISLLTDRNSLSINSFLCLKEPCEHYTKSWGNIIAGTQFDHVLLGWRAGRDSVKLQDPGWLLSHGAEYLWGPEGFFRKSACWSGDFSVQSGSKSPRQGGRQPQWN